MKKGFTVSETLIAMGILGVIAAFVIPSLNNSQPNKDRPVYSKAIFTLQSAMSNVMEDSYIMSLAPGEGFVPELFLANLQISDVCTSLAGSINTRGTVNCNVAGTYQNPNFISSDGIKFWFEDVNGRFGGGVRDSFEVVNIDYELQRVDRAKRVNDGGPDGEGLKIAIRNDGKVFTPNTEDYAYENRLIEHSMDLELRGRG